MTYNFDEVIDRRGAFSLKWDGGEFVLARGITDRFDDDTIPAFTADSEPDVYGKL